MRVRTDWGIITAPKVVLPRESLHTRGVSTQYSRRARSRNTAAPHRVHTNCARSGAHLSSRLLSGSLWARATPLHAGALPVGALTALLLAEVAREEVDEASAALQGGLPSGRGAAARPPVGESAVLGRHAS